MSKICQEKFEVRIPDNHNEETRGWVSDKSVRSAKGLSSGDKAFYNRLPPGQNIANQEVSDQPPTPFSMGGETDVSKDWNPTAIRQGWSSRKMLPTDDMWTNEHCDAFYGEMTVDGVTGFLERNNMLDRQ